MHSSDRSSNSDSGSVDEDAAGDKMLETLMKSKDRTIRLSGKRKDCSVNEVLDEISKINRLSKDADILAWWRQDGPRELLEVAYVILALPVSQVSVERTFSGLRYIMDDLRMRLNDKSIDAIMILRCNT